MKERDNIAVRRDDLNVMINAIENMMSSLNLLSSSLAGVLPEQILPAHLPLIAENLLSYFFHDIPYYIYTDRHSDEYPAETETAIRQLLLLIPALPSMVDDNLEVKFIELRIEEETTAGDTLLELSFSETVSDSEKKRIAEKWERLPESIKTEVKYSFKSPEETKSLMFIPAK